MNNQKNIKFKFWECVCYVCACGEGGGGGWEAQPLPPFYMNPEGMLHVTTTDPDGVVIETRPEFYCTSSLVFRPPHSVRVT